jgi:hypothetical protein
MGSLLGALGSFERGFQLLRSAYSMRQALGDEAGMALSAGNLQVLEHLVPAPALEQVSEPTTTESTVPPPKLTQEEIDEPSPRSGRGRAARLGITLIAATVLVVLVVGAFGLLSILSPSNNDDGMPQLSVFWEFGDAANAFDNKTWTQEVIILAEGGDGDYGYFVDGSPVGRMFVVTLPLCDGARGTIEVQSGDGQTARVDYEFDSPFCQ